MFSVCPSLLFAIFGGRARTDTEKRGKTECTTCAEKGGKKKQDKKVITTVDEEFEFRRLAVRRRGR